MIHTPTGALEPCSLTGLRQSNIAEGVVGAVLALLAFVGGRSAASGVTVDVPRKINNKACRQPPDYAQQSGAATPQKHYIGYSPALELAQGFEKLAQGFFTFLYMHPWAAASYHSASGM